MNKRLFLLDAYALIYRAYFAFIRNPRITSRGLNTSAIFGFTNTLIDVLKKENPTHIAVVFDVSAPTFRHELYKPYKATRQETPEDIRKAIPFIKQLIEAFNIPIIELAGFEADDIIGTLAKRAEKHGFTTFMMTPDKDYSQLVSENIFMYKPGRSGADVEILGVKQITDNFKIKRPEQVIDILALWGDSSDNIPGAPGIGEKKATKLIGDFDSVENLLENTAKLQGKEKETIVKFREQIILSKTLVTIVTDVPIEWNEEQLLLQKPDNERLKNLFEELEFRTLAARVLQASQGAGDTGGELHTPVSYQPTTPVKSETKFDGVQGDLFGPPPEKPASEAPVVTNYETISTVLHEYHLVDNAEKRCKLINDLLSQKEICFDTETTGLETHNSELVGIAFCYKSHEAYYVPVPQNREEAQQLIEELRCVLENENILKIGQNLKFDILILKNYGIEVKGKFFDTLLAHYLIQPELRHNLNYLAEIYLNYHPVPIEDLIGKKGKNQQSMRLVAYEKIKEYACEDADITWQLRQLFTPELEKNNLTGLFEDIEMPLVNVLAAMEFSGVKLDIKELNNYAAVLRTEIIEIENDIYRMAGTPFNISSPKQLGEILFERLQIPEEAKKTKTQQYSTGEEVLVKIKDKHPVVEKILDYRSLRKLLSTYIEALPELVNSKTKRLHTSYNQAIVSTGRLSSNNPNLQNIPIREEKGREIRKSFVPTDENYVFLSADYSQIELRIMAHLSEDPHMLEAFNNNEDIHTATAAKIYKIPIAEVSSDMRRKAKTANFGIIYGISAFGLSERLSISRKEAKELIDGYFATYPRVKEYMDKCIYDARQIGYVETIFRRRRYLADINSRNASVRGMAERNAINAPIQGSAADIIKIAMIRIADILKSKNLRAKMIIQVHDELDFEVFKPELDEVKQMIIQEMQNAVVLKVPLIVDAGVGNNWLEAH